MTIAHILSSRDGTVVTVAPSDRVSAVIALLAERRIGCVPVMEAGTVVGIFSERDVIYGVATHGAAMMDRAVGEVMTSPAVTVESSTPVLVALSMMTRRRIRHLPVVDSGALVGFISIGDLVKHRIDHIEREADAMRAYIQSA